MIGFMERDQGFHHSDVCYFECPVFRGVVIKGRTTHERFETFSSIPDAFISF